MNSAASFQNPISPFKRGRLTKEESTKRAFTFSLIAHLGLLAFLVIGISWNNSTPAGVEVELWDSTPQVQTPPEPEVKTIVKEEAADIVLKKKKAEKEPPKITNELSVGAMSALANSGSEPPKHFCHLSTPFLSNFTTQ